MNRIIQYRHYKSSQIHSLGDQLKNNTKNVDKKKLRKVFTPFCQFYLHQ